MWPAFVVATLCTAILLYLPGIALLKLFRFSLLASIIFSPPISLALYGILTMIYGEMGIFSSWTTLFIPLLIVNIVMCGILWLRRRRMSKISVDGESLSQGILDSSIHNWIVVALYCAVGILVTLFVFVKNLDGPESVSQLFDNAWHMSIIRKFVNTGDYSTLNSGDIIATVGSKFYPTGWHSIVALVVSMTGFSIGLCENAVNSFICAVVFPVSMYALFITLFPRRPRLMSVMSITPLLSAAYPWRFITFGPLYSNLLSFSITPLVMALLIRFLDAEVDLHHRVRLLCLFTFALVGVAITQPNAVFTLGVLVAPYLFYQIPKYLLLFKLDVRKRRVWCLVLWGVSVIGIAIIWYILYNASFMQRTVTWGWPSFESKAQAFIDIIFVGFHSAEPQIILGLLIILGIAYTVIHAELSWIACAYLIMCMLYALSSSTEGIVKDVLTGFWYHDSYRLGASAVFFGAALAGLGMNSLIMFGKKAQDIVLSRPVGKPGIRVFSFLTVLTVLAINYFPNYYLSGRYDVTTAFGAIRRDVLYWNAANEPKSYDEEERWFVDRVKQIVPEDALILNQPYDGSVYAYGMDDLNVYYKAWEGNWMGKPTEDNYLISTQLDHLAQSNSVQEAVRRTGAEYLILLNRDDYSINSEDSTKMTSIYASYISDNWRGIDAIDDHTEGFKEVLSQDGMRLYEIELD